VIAKIWLTVILIAGAAAPIILVVSKTPIVTDLLVWRQAQRFVGYMPGLAWGTLPFLIVGVIARFLKPALVELTCLFSLIMAVFTYASILSFYFHWWPDQAMNAIWSITNFNLSAALGYSCVALLLNQIIGRSDGDNSDGLENH
jgi:hypothetical protein